MNCEVISHAVVVTLIMATLEPFASTDDSQTQPLTNGTSRTITGRELQAELDEENGGITPLHEGDGSDEATPSIAAAHTPASPFSTSTSRSRASNSSSTKRKYISHQVFEEEEESMMLQQHEIITPKKSHRTSSTSPAAGGSGNHSPGIAYLSGMTRLRKIIMDEEEDS